MCITKAGVLKKQSERRGFNGLQTSLLEEEVSTLQRQRKMRFCFALHDMRYCELIKSSLSGFPKVSTSVSVSEHNIRFHCCSV